MKVIRRERACSRLVSVTREGHGLAQVYSTGPWLRTRLGVRLLRCLAAPQVRPWTDTACLSTVGTTTTTPPSLPPSFPPFPLPPSSKGEGNVMEELDMLVHTPEYGQLTLHQRRRLDVHRQSGALRAWMAAADATRRKRKKRRKKRLPKSGRRLLPLSPRCSVRQWIHVPEHVFGEPLVSGSHFANVLASVHGGFWKNFIHLPLSLPWYKQVCSQLCAARSLTMCLPLVSALNVVRTSGRFALRP